MLDGKALLAAAGSPCLHCRADRAPGFTPAALPSPCLSSLFGFCCGGPGEADSAVLLASHGLGASRQERHPVVADAAWSSSLQLRASQRDSLAARIPSQVGTQACLHCRVFDCFILSALSCRRTTSLHASHVPCVSTHTRAQRLAGPGAAPAR